ncbi:MAG TPA: valine--tRNA ligase [Clostridiales bacterium]|jgi:valyl-tRNA synthetase|nr:valine--tRNA ligase [Clostridiales bacterium]
MENLAKKYNPKEFEDRIYKMWNENGYFKADPNDEKEPFTIVLPPPNITGQLHMGHALDHILQDILIRWKRMDGYEALWLPGTDHASIATEVKVVEKLRSEGLEKDQIGREKFLEKAWEWKEEYGGRITQQMKKLGNSCDWSRERFTMDEGCSKAVNDVFVKLYEKGLIYRGNRIINWCPDCLTSLSDIEVEHEEKDGKYYYVKYYFVDNDDEYFTIATTRPETIFGDTAIAVHPDDERYQKYIGKKVVVPIVGREIEIIADEYPDMDKGTGALKITPSHDPNDFEIGKRHNLEEISCMNEKGIMNSYAGKYEGMDRYECRKAFVKDLEDKDLIVKVEKTEHSVGTCYRCNTVIEPRISEQWFVKMEPLAGPAIEAVKKGKTKFVPERFDKIYFHWLENIRDWCISRQLWWGHRIPAYYCQDCGEVIVSKDKPKKCTKCGSGDLKQDEDVLDTWFSSALWPFSTLGWPEETEDLKYFYPTDVLVTGYDIIFFWVIRMMFSGIEHMNEVPFKHVLIHGLVRDAEGKKMSKSLGNGVDPLEVIDEFGADALRFMLVTGLTPGNDTRYQIEKLEASRNFANKLWNASRFVLMNLDEKATLEAEEKDYKSEDKWILSRINKVTEEVNKNLSNFDLGLGLHKIYEFIWNEYCDWYIELVKPRLYGENEKDKNTALYVLVKVMKDMLKLLHPFMPFITEEIWQYLPGGEDALIVSDWPKVDIDKSYQSSEEEINFAMEIIKSIRNIKAEMDVKPSKKIKGYFVPKNQKYKEYLINIERHLDNLINLEEMKIAVSKDEIKEDAASSVIDGLEIYLPLSELIDFEKEKERLAKEKEKLESEIKRAEGKLKNKSFVEKAPEKIVNEEKDKLEKYKDMYQKVLDRINQINS